MDFVLKGFPSIDGDDGHFVVVKADEVGVGIDIDFGVVEVGVEAGIGDHLFGFVAEGAASASIKCYLRFHLPVKVLAPGIALARHEEVDEGDAGQEASDMGEKCDTSALGGVG